MTQNTESDPTASVRKIPVWVFIVLAIVCVAILQSASAGETGGAPAWRRPIRVGRRA
jgi:hypothetical protein